MPGEAASEISQNITQCIDHLTENECKNQSASYQSQIQSIASKITTNTWKLDSLVQLLAGPLTDISINNRSAGTCFLADILGALGPDYIQQEELSYFVNFFCDRLKDNIAVIPYAVNGLLYLSQNKNLSTGSSKQIISTLFKEIQNQAQIQSVRYATYMIAGNLLQSHLSELQEMKEDFVYGFIQAMDGEKDPRNLMVVFRIIPFIAKNFPLKIFAEEFFEVISCYFPIDFSPPPNAPHGVTKQSLIEELRKCLSASSLFAPFALPMLLEKLDSDLQDAKIDSLLTLAACSDSYGAANLSPFFHAMWMSLRREMFLSCSDDVQAASLNALTSLTKTLSTSLVETSSKSVLEEFLEEIVNECKKYLCEPELKLIHPSAKILVAIAVASHTACRFILTHTIPLLLDQYSKHSQVNRKNTIVDIINSLLAVYANLVQSSSETLEFNWEDVFALYFSIFPNSDPVLCHTVLLGFRNALMHSGFIDSEKCTTLVDYLYSFIMNESLISTHETCFELLKRLAILHPEIVHGHALPKLMSVINNDDLNGLISTSNSTDSSKTIYAVALNALTATCVSDSISNKVSCYVITHITELCGRDSPVNLSKVLNCVNCLHKIVLQNSVDSSSVELSIQNIFYPLLKLTIESSLSASPSILQNRNVIIAVAQVLASITRVQNADEMQKLSNEILNLYMCRKSAIVQFENASDFNPLHTTATLPQAQLIIVLQSVVCSLTESCCVIPPELLKRLEAIVFEPDETISEAAVYILASVANKSPDDSKLLTWLSELKENAAAKMELTDSFQCDRALKLWVWLTKALVLRGHSLAQDFIAKLLTCFGSSVLGKEAADGFRIIVEDDDVLSAESHANIRILYRQRLFTTTFASLVEGFKAAGTQDEKICFLICVVHLLQLLPRHLINDSEPLIPLLIQALAFEKTRLLVIVLNILNDLLCHDPEKFSPYVTSLIPVFLRLSQTASNMTVRVEALKCLQSLTSQPPHVIVPVCSDVVHGLVSCLDDRKRLVRKQAVVTRGKWFLVGTP